VLGKEPHLQLDVTRCEISYEVPIKSLKRCRLSKKPTWLNTLEVFDHVGLLINGLPDPFGSPFI
jgi:hypothetical protein